VSGATDADGAASGLDRRLGFAQHDLDRMMRFMELGWMRHLPPAVALILEGIGNLPRVMLEERIDREGNEQVWEELPWGEESPDPQVDLQIAATLHPEVTDQAELTRLSVQDRAEAAAHLRARQDRFSRICGALGIAEPKTTDDVYPFLLALGVIEEYKRGNLVWVRSLATELDPIDVLRLDDQTSAKERACRGELRFMPIEAIVAQRFRAAGGRDAHVTTSLLRLARLAGLSVEQLRLCLTGGVDAGILSCSQVLSTLEEHRIFELRIPASCSEAVQLFATRHRLAA
jgi:Family of unknown function (DUF6042)